MTQSEALEILKTGSNVFLTGEPGAGKTYLLNQYISWLKKHDVDAAVTAYTGIAASHVGGRTLHSWAGMVPGVALSPDDERSRIRHNGYLLARLLSAKVLIIDEISMLHPHEFDRVDFICKTARNSLEPFGGLQLICCGDFFQIPPVSAVAARPENIPEKLPQDLFTSAPKGKWGSASLDAMNAFLAGVKTPPRISAKKPAEDLAVIAAPIDLEKDKFVIDSAAWKGAGMKVCYLQEQHRQGDEALLTILQEIRKGTVSAESLTVLKSRLHAKVAAPIGIARLYTHNENVDAINIAEAGKLAGPEVIYQILTRGDAKLVERLKKENRVDIFALKIGARVMFTKNKQGMGYVNGTLGEVVGFQNGENYPEALPVVRTFDNKEIIVERESWEIMDDEKVVASIRQIPLRLAWAITVHKSQGMTLDAVEIDLSRAFDRGMGYVALSRVKALENISLLGFNQTALEVSERIKKLDEDFLAQSEETEVYLHDLGPKKLKAEQKEFLDFITADQHENENDSEGNGHAQKENHYSIVDALAELDEISYEPDATSDIPAIDFE